MKNASKFLVLSFVLVTLMMMSSCRKENVEFDQAPEGRLEANSAIADLVSRVAMKDGSFDNIIDVANCFTIKLPVTVNVNNVDVEIQTTQDLNIVEAILDIEDEDVDFINVNYPVTIILSDHTEVLINNLTEMQSYTNSCTNENEIDADIECIDFVYPITASVFNTSNEIIDNVMHTNDKEFFAFVKGITSNDIVTVDFPVVMNLADGSQDSLNTLNDLRAVIEAANNSCDEDDDFDYSDDDCDTCTVNQLKSLLINDCSDWYVKDLTRNNVDSEDTYNGYDFSFSADDTMSVTNNTNFTYYGTWTVSGTGNNITVAINIANLPDCNNNWVLHEIQEYSGEFKVDLTLGSDRLRYISNCE